MSIDVTYQTTSDAAVAKEWLDNTPELAAYDFEAAVKYSSEEIESFKQQYEQSTSRVEQATLQGKINATALGHPSHCTITHMSMAYSISEGYVFIMDNDPIREVVFRHLITTDKCQIWHNAGYDFRHIRYWTLKTPKNYEDTQIFAKCLRNHVDVLKAASGLKQLAGHMYGSWGISADNFTIEQMYEPHVLKYAATDACATYWLYQQLEDYIINNPEEI